MPERLQISGQCEPAPTAEVIVATDASVQRDLHSGAFISTIGQWGLDAARYSADHCRPHCVMAMELRAIWYGLRSFEPGTDITILTDSSNARLQIEAWQEGSSKLPKWYDIGPRGYYHNEGRPTLVALQERINEDAEHITIRHVKGHRGDLLNEAADGLAGIGLNYLRKYYDDTEARRRSLSLAASFLVSYSQQTYI